MSEHSIITNNDIVIHDIMLLLSNKTYDEAMSILDKSKKTLGSYCQLKLTTKRHEFIKDLMIKDLSNH